jgi:hypothetical protein
MLNRHLIQCLTIIFLFSTIIPGLLSAEDISLRATVDKNQVGLDDRFVYTVEISGKSTNLPDPSFPSLEGFSVLSGPNTSTNIQFINGAMSSSKSYSFYLVPQREGDFTIAAATLTIDGEEISSNTISIKVTKGTTQPPAAGPPAKKGQEEDLLGESLTLRTVVDKKKVYQNEQILVEYKLYFRVSVRSYNIEKIPSTSGFWMEEFKLTSQPPVSTEIINGINYQVATLRKVALFPTRSGDLTIEPMVISVDALAPKKQRSRSLFDNFFDDPFGRTVKKSLTSNPITINVRQLPVQNKPEDFDGVVGKYTLAATTDNRELKANEAISLKLNITGEGNLKLVKPPVLKLPPDMEVYEPREKTEITAQNNAIGGSKTVEYVIVPRLKGEYRIDPVSLSFFDPARGEYQRTTTKPIILNVLEGSAVASGLLGGSSLSKHEVELLGEDIRYIKQKAEFFITDQRLYTNWLYFFGYLVPILALIVVWRYQIDQTKLRGDIQLARRRKAGRLASKQLSQARKMMKSGDQTSFYRATSDALQGFVCNRLNLQISDFSSMNVKSELQKAGLGDEEVDEYLVCLQESDFRRYAGSQGTSGETDKFYERVKKILTRLEKYI